MTTLRTLLALATFATACGIADPVAPEEVDGSADAGSSRFTPVRFDGHYYAHSWLRNRCDRLLRLTGSEPVEAGRYPVAIFLVGTSGDHDYPGIVDNVLPILARHGFVAASLEYENATAFGAAQNCNLYRDNASCIVGNDADHVGGERRSAIAQLCGRAKADCGQGVVVLGHSQGGLTALQTFRFAPIAPPPPEPMPRLVAAAPLGVGPAGYVAGLRVVDLHDCMTTEMLAIDHSRLLVINGEHDAFFNGPDGDQAGGQAALEAVTGRSCAAPSWDCRAPSGDGYLLVKSGQISTGRAEHEFMSASGTSFGEPHWISPETTDAWGLFATARWLKAQTGP